MGAKLSRYRRYTPLPNGNADVNNGDDGEINVCRLERDENCEPSPQVQMENLHSLARITAADVPLTPPVSTTTNVAGENQSPREGLGQVSSDTSMAVVVVSEPERGSALTEVHATMQTKPSDKDASS